MDVNEHDRLSPDFIIRHKLKSRNSAFITFLHFTLTVRVFNNDHNSYAMMSVKWP